jgi:YHS domain-containing protein
MRWIAGCLLMLALCLSLACDKSSSKSKSTSPKDLPPDMTEPTTAPSTQVSLTPINKFCAVEHDDEVDPKVTTTYKGKLIGFCCDKCIPKFNKDPEKYMASLK